MFYIIATPIGNLKDITWRAIEILKKVDYILCEDTRVTRKILEFYKIDKKRLISYHQHTSNQKTERLLGLIKINQVALVTDAGTPGISDPGNKIIAQVVSKMPTIKIVPIPGPNAAISALSISGFPTDKFLFLGFPPHKKNRYRFFKQLMESQLTVVFYESCHRIIKTLKQLEEFGGADTKKVVVARELTKKFETIYRGDFKTVLQQVSDDPIKGEYVVVVS